VQKVAGRMGKRIVNRITESTPEARRTTEIMDPYLGSRGKEGKEGENNAGEEKD